jgi:hypothetical protein
MSVKVINVSSWIDVKKIERVSINNKLVIDTFRTMSKSIGVSDLQIMQTKKIVPSFLEKKRGHVISTLDSSPRAVLCVGRDNVKGGKLVFSSLLFPEAFSISPMPGDLCVFRDVEVWQDSIKPIDVDFDMEMDLLLWHF